MPGGTFAHEPPLRVPRRVTQARTDAVKRRHVGITALEVREEIVGPRRGRLPLGLVGAPEQARDPDLACTTVHDERMVPVCSPQHRLARARSVEAKALGGEAWITFPPRAGSAGEPYAAALAHRLAACGVAAAEMIPIDSLTAQKRMVEAGFGLALLPESSVDEEVRTGTLRIVNVAAMRVTIAVVLVHRRRAYLSGGARALRAVLAASWKTPTRGGPR